MQQRSLDDLGTPLHQVTFVVLDLETTGGSSATCDITEVGAVKYRGGELLGSFQTLVNPGVEVPPYITYLTGITQAMVLPAPKIDSVLPAFLEFIGDAVVVGHNVRFDLSFLNSASIRLGYGRMKNPSVDTSALARRLVRDEVPNCKLSTLATYFRTATTPNHRALEDAKATAELLHKMLERAAGLGVLGLDDLLALPKTAGHPQAAKLKLAANLPRKPGVYLFRDHQGRVLYVGKAIDLRRRVRSYFAGDERRKVGQLLREVHTIDHIVCTGDLEASVLEVRLIHELMPRFNRQAKLWRKYAYLKFTLTEKYPRFSVVRTVKAGDGCLYLGPLPSSGAAKLVAEAIESVVPIRRCTKTPSRTPKPAPCASAQLGVSTCPCAGAITEEEYAVHVGTVLRGLTADPSILLRPLEARMHDMAVAERYEEAAAARDRAAALSRAIGRQRRFESLRRAGRLAVEIPGEGGAVLHNGRLVAAWSGDAPPPPMLPFDHGVEDGPVPCDLADELACIARWLEAKAAQLRVLGCEGGLASALPRVASYAPRTREAVAPVR